ncbi:hypothetical protein DH2020_029579 [Rehmannia glutinosa]|uniref:Pescadillo homolog n=1 Tax=Rehmannia glutinosa TaxID=99300 RepID=A0ABR0VNX8_REHGL
MDDSSTKSEQRTDFYAYFPQHRLPSDLSAHNLLQLKKKMTMNYGDEQFPETKDGSNTKSARQIACAIRPHKQRNDPSGVDARVSRYHYKKKVIKKLCILKGVFPREPKKKVKGNHHSYYHMKDIMFLKHEPLLEKLRDIRSYEKKVKKAMSKKNRDLAERLLTRKPTYTLDMLIKESELQFAAEVEGQKITWLTPHALQQVLPEVDYRILLTFLEFYEQRQPSAAEYNAHLMLFELCRSLSLSRYFDANAQSSSVKTKAVTSPGSEQTEHQHEGTKLDESELRLAQLQQQLPSNEAGALMHLVEDAGGEDEEDLETQECKNLFKNMKFFLSREVPRESLLFVIPAFGGTVSWEGEGAPLRSLTTASLISVPPPHLSPFVDNEAEGHIPEYAEAIQRLKNAERKEVLPLPGMGKEDLDDPHSLLGINDRKEAIEAAERKQKMSIKQKQYHEELNLELQGSQYSALSSDIEAKDAEGDAVPNMQQIVEDASNMSKVLMPRRKRKLLEAMEIGKEKKRAHVHRLKERKKKIDEAKKST